MIMIPFSCLLIHLPGDILDHDNEMGSKRIQLDAFWTKVGRYRATKQEKR